MKSGANDEKVSEIFEWILMNVVIVIGIPVAKLILLKVAEETIDMASLMSDYSLIAFSIAFNVGAYITDKLQKVPYISTEALAEDVAEELVRKNSAASASLIAKDFFDTLSVVLTDESKKCFEKTFMETEEEEKKIKVYNKYTYLFAAVCLFFFGGLTIIKIRNDFALFVLFLVLSGMLAICICIWASLNRSSRKHPIGVITETNSTQKQTVAEPPVAEPMDLAEQEEAPQEEAPQEEAPQEEAPQEEAPQEEAPQEEAPQEEAPQEEAPQEEAPQEEASQEEASQEEAPQEEVLQEKVPQE